MALILFAFWLLLAARFRWAKLILGAAASIFLAILSNYLLPRQYHSRWSGGMVARAPVFFTLLLWEIACANLDVFKRVMSPSLPIDPRIVSFDSYLESDNAKSVLAGAINLTPGTVTLEIDGSRFYVHCLAEAHDADLAEGKLERMVAWLFGEGHRVVRLGRERLARTLEGLAIPGTEARPGIGRRRHTLQAFGLRLQAIDERWLGSRVRQEELRASPRAVELLLYLLRVLRERGGDDTVGAAGKRRRYHAGQVVLAARESHHIGKPHPHFRGEEPRPVVETAP